MEALRSKVIRLKVLVNTKEEKVLFAEAEKTAVDLLIQLCLQILAIFTGENALGNGLGNFMKSIKNMEEKYFEHGKKDALLKPAVFSGPFRRTYRCRSHYCGWNFSHDPTSTCLDCGESMSREMKFVRGKELAGAGGFVKGGDAVYTVMDDLVVKPMGSVSTMALAIKCNELDVGALTVQEVELGLDELLKTCLVSNDVLTTALILKKTRKN